MKTYYLIFLLIFLLHGTAHAQPEWIVYDTSNSGLPSNILGSIAIDANGNKWIGTSNGLAKFDNTNWTVYDTSNSGLPVNSIGVMTYDASDYLWFNANSLVKFDGVNWAVYNTVNSGLPADFVTSIAIDASGNKWLGTWGYPPEGGLAKFDGLNWIIYTESNSGLPWDKIFVVVIDGNDNKWIGCDYDPMITWGGGLAKFDGINWTVYKTDNSDLPSNEVKAIAVDNQNNIWVGTRAWNWGGHLSGGLAEFDGANWTVYDTTNSELPDNNINFIAIDANGNKWIGTMNGLAKFDGTNWTVYDTTNSGLPTNQINSITIDSYGNKWLGTPNGLAVFKEGGVIGIQKDNFGEMRMMIYPNPVSETATINYYLPLPAFVSIAVYDMLGKKVDVLVNEYKMKGQHKEVFNATERKSGLYIGKVEIEGQVITDKFLIIK